MPPTGRPWPPGALPGAFCRPEREPSTIAGIWSHGSVRWEQHAEFTTFTWELAGDADPFTPASGAIATVMEGIPQPGPLLVSADLHLVTNGDVSAFTGIFDPASLAVSHMDGAAVTLTDFRPDASGFVRILVLDQGLGPARAGALVQRLLEIETYRTLALLGLPEAQALSPRVKTIEEFAHSHRIVDDGRVRARHRPQAA